MKTRVDFVTNSSSSSFILAFDSKNDGLAKIAVLLSDFDHECILRLLLDFCDGKPIPREELFEKVQRDLESMAYYTICYGEDWSEWDSRKGTFRNRWEKAHPGAEYADFYRSEEFATEKERLIKKYFDELLAKIGERSYIVEIEYEDHSAVGSELEHSILPDCDFTVQQFSNH